jgi:hypothetical protein
MLYGARVDQRECRIALTFYVAPDLSADERDDLTAAGAMVISDYASSASVCSPS